MNARFVLGSALVALSLGACDQGASDAPALDDFRIVGGQQTSGDPAVPLLLLFDGTSDQPMGVCTGTLIDAQWVLTAAHCVAPEVQGIGVYFGTDAMAQQDPGFIHYGQVDTAEVNPGWQNGGAPDQGNDLALVHLSEPAPLQPIPINRTALSQDMLGAPVHLAGWGLTGGGKQDSGLKRAVESTLHDFDDQFAVVGDTATGTCNGDSGGPAFMNIGGQTVLMGVTSYGDVDCEQISVDMRVDAFVGWIDETTGMSGPQPGNGTGGTGGNGTNSGGAGDTCTAGGDCNSGLCVDNGDAGFCTDQCSTDDDCPSGWACFGTNDPSLQVCAPDGDDDNGPSLPTLDGGDDDQTNDGGDHHHGGGDSYPSAADDEDQGGCTIGSRTPTPGFLALLLLAAFRRRR